MPAAEEAYHVEEVPITIDWNTVDISDRTDLIIAPMSDIQVATMFGIPVDEKDKEKEKDEAADDGNRQSRTAAFYVDIDSELMHDVAVEVGDGHADELICVYDKENPVIEVAKVDKRCPGSVVEIDTEVTPDGKVYFSKFFMALKACIDGFKEGCRPYLSIDSSFLTSKWNGQLAACNALDGHNWMYPVAIGLFQSETEASWTWFMMQLKRSIGQVSPLEVHTDACKGLQNAVKNIFPMLSRGSALVIKFRGDAFGCLWPATRAYKLSTHEYHLNKIKEASTEFGR
ncbi:hypothetical protein QYE76_031179 [Lolium multiflorum]|uniref:MULE transposase domain-containing protein n=1 Tax=Lolium multiflorum TaxID=4521 RepID=A0AAD8VJH1_LOLMU|nr:hypothetical protein QYE76_031179 [Lolium multiflorum]